MNILSFVMEIDIHEWSELGYGILYENHCMDMLEKKIEINDFVDLTM